MSVFVKLRSCEGFGFLLLLFPLSWNCAGILLSFMYTTYGALFLYLDSTKCTMKVYVLRRTERKCNDDRYASARPQHFFITRTRFRDIRIGRSHWKKMSPGKYGDRKIVASFYYNCPQESFVFFLKKPLYLEISNAKGTKG